MPLDPAALHVHLNEKRPVCVPKGDWASLFPSVLHIRAEQKQQQCPGHSRPAGHAAPTPRGRSCRPPVETPTITVCVANTVTVLQHRQQQQKTLAPLPPRPAPHLLLTGAMPLGACHSHCRRALGSPGLQCCSPHCLFTGSCTLEGSIQKLRYAYSVSRG